MSERKEITRTGVLSGLKGGELCEVEAAGTISGFGILASASRPWSCWRVESPPSCASKPQTGVNSWGRRLKVHVTKKDDGWD